MNDINFICIQLLSLLFIYVCMCPFLYIKDVALVAKFIM